MAIKEKKSPGLAAVLSFLFTGLGQIYCGRIGRGLALFLGAPIAILMFFFVLSAIIIGGAQGGGEEAARNAAGAIGGLYIMTLLGAFTLWVWNIYDAYSLAVTINRGSGNDRRRRGRRNHRRSDERRPRRRSDERPRKSLSKSSDRAPRQRSKTRSRAPRRRSSYSR